MHTRTAIIIVSVLAVLLLAGGALFVLLYSKSPAATPPTQQPGVLFPGGQTTMGPTRTIATLEGSQVTVPDFTQGATSVPVSSDPTDVQYDLTPYPDYVPGTPYPTHVFDVAFNQSTSEFIVLLNEEPLSRARLAAEAFLASKLGVTTKGLCELNVTISVPLSVNERYANYNNLGPSSCEGAVVLP